MDTEQYWKDRGVGYLNEFRSQCLLKRGLFWLQERSIRKSLPSDIESVLEIGCGFGRITKILLENPDVKHILAIDLSEDQIRNAKKSIDDHRVEFKHMSLFDLDCENQYDLVIASEVLMHISPDRVRDAISSMEKASKKYIMNIDWYAPGESCAAGGWCWQHDYVSLYENAKMIKKLHRQGIFFARV